MFVKKFLFQKYYGEREKVVDDIVNRFDQQIRSIEAYIKVYHYSNFLEVYRKFDREELVLLDEDFRGAGGDQIRNDMNDYYESFSYLGKLSVRKMQKMFQMLK